MKDLSGFLKEATWAIEQEFFQVKIMQGPSVYRERVYCYELYHRLRCLWKEDCPFVLNGELDKSGHQLLETLGLGPSKPDFLVHKPGKMSHNYAIIEVKGPKAGKDAINKDLETLDRFVTLAGYRRAIYLFFGEQDPDGLISKIQIEVAQFKKLAPIEVWLHDEVGKPAECIGTYRVGCAGNT